MKNIFKLLILYATSVLDRRICSNHLEEATKGSPPRRKQHSSIAPAMAKSAPLAVTIILLLLGSPAAGTCYSKCRFVFCDSRTAFFVGGTPDIPFTGPICDKHGRHIIGDVGRVGEAVVVGHTRNESISKWRPDGLVKPFPADFFQSFAIPATKHNYAHSGIGHDVAEKNQAKFIKGKCFLVPIEEYKVLDKLGKVVSTRNSSDPKHDCVAFHTLS